MMVCRKTSFMLFFAVISMQLELVNEKAKTCFTSQSSTNSRLIFFHQAAIAKNKLKNKHVNDEREQKICGHPGKYGNEQMTLNTSKI